MSLLTAAQAATLADLAYDVTSAPDSAGATARIKGSLAAAQKRAGRDPGTANLDGFSAKAGLTGQSGGFALKDTTGFGAVLERKVSGGKDLVIAFRGSQTALDWVSNLNTAMEAGPGGSTVHAGFNRIYASLQDELARQVDGSGAQAVHLVGHSLGGALATLAMADLGLSQSKVACHLYTFGTPRIGGFGFNSKLRTLLTNDTVRRVYSVSDPVPMLPLMPFQHFMTGATGVNMGYAYITAKAHDRINYRNQMPAQGWPAPLPLPVKSDPEYWLSMAERSSGFSAAGYQALSMALTAIMRHLDVIGIGMSAGLTVLDRLADALSRAVLATARVAEQTLRFVKAALQLIGRTALRAMVSAADLTAFFLRQVFEMLFAPVRMAAQTALTHMA